MTYRKSLVIVCVLVLALGSGAAAEWIAPIDATASSEYIHTNGTVADADNTINSSGLATGGSHSTDWWDMWVSKENEVSPTIKFDLGALHLLDGMHVWNCNQVYGITDYIDRGIKTMDIWISATGTGDDPTDQQSGQWTKIAEDMQLDQATASSSYEGEFYTLSSGWGRYVFFNDVFNYDGDSAGLSEIRFWVPEPSLLALLGFGGLAIFLRRKRRK